MLAFRAASRLSSCWLTPIRMSCQLANGQPIPLIGLGTWQTDETTGRSTLRTAIEIGYRQIDTAFVYRNESFLGEELQQIFKEGKVKREEIFVISKLPCNGLNPKNVEYFLMKSLKDLRLDYLDLYLIHSPIATKRTDDDYEFHSYENGDIATENIDLVDTWKAMEPLVDKGLVRYLGLSNCNSRQIKKVHDAARIKPTNVQVECHAYLQQEELFAFCKNLNISFTGYSPLGSPGFPEFVKKKHQLEINPKRLLDEEKLLPIAEKHKKTKAQILIRFLVQRGIIAIPKSSNPERMRENFEVFDFNLDEEDLKALRSMNDGFRYFKMDYSKSYIEHPEQPFLNDAF